MKWLPQLMVVFSIGCGASTSAPVTYPVTGKLTVKNVAIPQVNVQLVPEDLKTGKSFSTGRTDAEGKFTLYCTNGQKGAVPGKYKIVLAIDAKPPESGKTYTGPKTEQIPFPKEYSSASTSPRLIEVTNQPVTVDLAI